MKKRILFVDDEGMVLQGLKRMLRSCLTGLSLLLASVIVMVSLAGCGFEVLATHQTDADAGAQST